MQAVLLSVCFADDNDNVLSPRSHNDQIPVSPKSIYLTDLTFYSRIRPDIFFNMKYIFQHKHEKIDL